MSSYMDIIKTLGPNKVTMSIRVNSFEESIAFSVAVKNAAENAYHLLDPLAVMRSMKREKTTESVKPPPIMSSYSSMLYAVLCHIDPLVSLLGPDDIKKKVMFFQEQIKTSQLLTTKIRNKVRLDDEEATLHLLSHVLKKNIIVIVGGSTADLHYVSDDAEVVVLKFNMIDKTYTLDTDVRMTVKDCILICTAGYETMLVKDLKRVAKMIGVSGSTKSELITAIKSKIDSYI